MAERKDLDSVIFGGLPKRQIKKLSSILGIVKTLDAKEGGKGAMQFEVIQMAKEHGIEEAEARRCIDWLIRTKDLVAA